MIFDLIVIGGGAAGFFGAINFASLGRNRSVLIIEKTNKLLSKVKVSGGGRCNVTHLYNDTSTFMDNYPRGKKELRSPVERFSPQNIEEWFKQRGIELHTERDGRRFPVSNDSQTIIDCFLNECERLNIKIATSTAITSIERTEDHFTLCSNELEFKSKFILCATGGNPSKEYYSIYKKLGHTLVDPLPSLFTFNIPGHPICKLMGLSVPEAKVSLPEIKKNYSGPLLITHWGISGPSVLKLSAFCAEELAKRNYQFMVEINWDRSLTTDSCKEALASLKTKHPAKQIGHSHFSVFPSRLWHFLLTESGIDPEMKLADLSKIQLNKLSETITSYKLQAKGKTTFKEEFVTCGGIELKEINFKTMESKRIPDLYFAGEVLNFDGITGGFNFQAAWSTSYIAALSMSEKELLT